MSNLTEISNSLTNTTNGFSNGTDLKGSIDENTTLLYEQEYRNTIISDYVKSDTEFFIYVLFMPVFCTCGIIGNSLAMDVFLDIARRLKRSIYIYMFALVTVDSLSMCVFLFRSVPVIIGLFDDQNGHYWQMHTLIPVVYFDLIFKTMNSSVLIIMSLERLVSIRNPLTVRETTLAKYPVPIVGVTCAIITFGILPLPICLEVQSSMELNGTEVHQIVTRKGMENFLYIFVLLQTVIGSYLPFFTLVCLNIAILIQYRHEQRKRKQILALKGNLETQLRVMATVSVIIFMYTVLNLPQMFVQTLTLVDETFSFDGSESNLFWFLLEIANILVIINCSVDFIIYILMSATYRERFKQRICHGCFNKG